MTKETYTSGGISFTNLLTILFIALKLTGHIAWSWWWVLSPIWIVSILIIVLFVVGIGLAVIFD